MTSGAQAQSASFGIRRWARPLFICTILLGSFLLFLIQPMFARMVLPQVGGAPAVWTTAMLCYQGLLLGGYSYAHLIGRLPQVRQAAVHLALFVAAGVTLPLGVAAIPTAWQQLDPSLWLIGLFVLSIGPVFFAVAAQAPLMQLWFTRTGDPSADRPYFLYAASNAGSLAALIAYPVLVEPALTVSAQTALWSSGFLLLAVLILLCALAASGSPQAHTSEAAAGGARMPRPSWRERLRWVMLAAVPSGLMLSTTTHLTTDIMAMPLLWVVPLALYLITFIVAFSGSAALFRADRLAPVLLLVLGSYVFMAEGILAFLMAVAGLALFFYVALALHAELARLQPPASQLTDYYLWVSVGGVTGGLFCALVAPLAFDWLYEHPVLLVAAALLLPATPLSRRLGHIWNGRLRPLLVYVLPPLTLVASLVAGGELFAGGSREAIIAIVVAIGTAAVLSIGRPLAYAWHYAMLLLALGGWATIDTSTIPYARERSFFGIYSIEGSRAQQLRKLMHGTTLHGAQSLKPELATQPMSYYAPESGAGLAMRAAPRLFGDRARIGFVGLGTGTLSCYAEPGQQWTAYEIDPLVVRIARDSGLFTYLPACTPDLRIALGDARLTLSGATPSSLDVLALDAFSSDAIPLHLMTAEAFQTYGRALEPGGLLLVHISNRFLDLEPVVAAIARQQGWHARMMDYDPEATPPGYYYSRSLWIAMSRDRRSIDRLVAESCAMRGPCGRSDRADGRNAWRPLVARAGFAPWTDDFASVIPLLKR
jgi:spermidine synthase